MFEGSKYPNCRAGETCAICGWPKMVGRVTCLAMSCLLQMQQEALGHKEHTRLRDEEQRLAARRAMFDSQVSSVLADLEAAYERS